jgi:hypothetical protein
MVAGIALAVAIARAFPDEALCDETHAQDTAEVLKRDGRSLPHRLRDLADDLETLERTGAPPPDRIANAPILERWGLAPARARILRGTLAGPHPDIATGRTITSSQIFATDEHQWARTLSRWYGSARARTPRLQLPWLTAPTARRRQMPLMPWSVPSWPPFPAIVKPPTRRRASMPTTAPISTGSSTWTRRGRLPVLSRTRPPASPDVLAAQLLVARAFGRQRRLVESLRRGSRLSWSLLRTPSGRRI